jgi:hypothetical protein
MAQCKSCGADVLWVKLIPHNRLNPVNPTPTREGNIRMLGVRKAVARVLSKADLAEAALATEELYTSHFATCPNAKQHRSKS